MSRRSRKTSRPDGRDASDHRYAERARPAPWTLDALLVEPPRAYARPIVELLPPPLVNTFEDRRTWHPEPDFARSPKTAPSGRPAMVVVPKAHPAPKNRSWAVLGPPPATLAFERPRVTPVCVRRQTRRQVLHALGRAGGRVKPPTRGPFSHLSCR